MLLTPPPAQTPRLRDRGSTSPLLPPRVTTPPLKLPPPVFLLRWWWGLRVVWFVAREVWEVRFADVTLSPVYTAGMGLVSEERGMSMRFPRFIRIREDKGIDEASTGRQLAEMWEKQNETVAPEVQEDVEEE